MLASLLCPVTTFIIVCSSYGLDDEKFENEHLHSNTSDPGQVSVCIVQICFVIFNNNNFINLIY